MVGPTIGYIDYVFKRNDNIDIGIGCNRYNRLGSGQQSIISIMQGPTIGIIDYEKKNRSPALVGGMVFWSE